MSEATKGNRPRAEVLLAFAAVYVLWGSTYLAIRIGVETIPPFLLAGLRHLTAGLGRHRGGWVSVARAGVTSVQISVS